MTLASVRRQIVAEWNVIRRKAGTRSLPDRTVIRAMYWALLPEKPKLLGSSQKVEKGLKRGVLTAVLYLSPATESGVNLCANATAGCAESCLGHNSGQLAIGSIGSKAAGINARLWKTALYVGGRQLFRRLLALEIAAHEIRAKRLGLDPAIRLDGSSDVGLATAIAADFPAIRFYDYTKSARRALTAATGGFSANYHVTFSRSGKNDDACLAVLDAGGNVAVVFDTRKGASLPDSWRGYPVLDGDETDVRFQDPPGHVVGLRFKAARDRAGHLAKAGAFVVRAGVA